MKKIAFAAGALLLLSSVYAEEPLTAAVKGRYDFVKQNLIETAEAMPEADYGFKLTPAQRTFGDWIAHTATSGYSYCSGIKGEPLPATKHEGKSKAELVKSLKDAFGYCDEALQGMTDRKALAETIVNGKKSYPVTYMISMVGGLNEHYGNLVGYLRSKGITPPSTARAAVKK
jgi:uncharacterized damage-inducible protein DinB